MTRARKNFLRTPLVFSLSALLACALFSCGNLGADLSSVQSEQNTVALKIGYGRISGNIGESKSVLSRSVVPTASDVLAGVSSYSVYAWGTKADGTAVPKTSPIGGTVAADNTFSIDLEYGTWTVRADGLDSGGTVLLSQSSSAVTLNASSPVANLAFSLGYAQDAGVTGALSLSLSYSAGDNIASIEYSLSPSSGTAISGTVSDVSSGTLVLDSSLDSTLGALEPGTYSLVIKFLDGAGGVVVRVDQSVQIYSNLTTNKIDGTAPYINAGGSIAVTNDVIKKFQSASIYVGGTGLTGTAASDANNGSQYEPVATLGRAFDIVADSLLQAADIPDGFKIYVQGDAALGKDVLVAAGKTVSVIGTNSSSYYTIDGGGTNSVTMNGSALNCSYVQLNKLNGLVISAGTAALSNCKITNGTALASADGGGGLYVGAGASASLTDCEISGCSAAKGGGIYNAGTLSINGGTINSNRAETGGGGICVSGASASAAINGCVIGDPTAKETATASSYANYSGGTGGGILLESGTLETTSGFKLCKNYSAADGGGMYSAKGLSLEGCDISYNYSATNGGGFGHAAAGEALLVSGSTFTKNAATSAGGGLCAFLNAGDLTISGSTFDGNQAGTNGGGIYTRVKTEISDSTIKNGSASGGAGIYARDKMLYIKDGASISSNKTANGGGGIVAVYLTMTGGEVKSNSAQSTGGGGIYVYGGGTAAISGGTISDNSVSGGFGGGIGIAATGSLALSGGTISGNKAYVGGEDGNSGGTAGGVYVAANSILVMTGGTISQNESALYGGGIWCGGTASMSDGLITGNTAKGAHGGAGVYIMSGSFTLSGGTISGNTAENAGGGGVEVYTSMEWRAQGKHAAFGMTGGTISSNSAATNGGGVLVGDFSTFAMGGSASVPPGSENKNDVYLESADYPVNVSSALTASAPVAVITPASYASGKTVVQPSSASLDLDAVIAKFAVTPDGGEAWTIVKNADGTAGVLYSATIYVDGANGSDSTGGGTKNSPYKTIAHALDNVLAANCVIVVVNGTTETKKLSITPAMQGLAIKSSDGTKKTVAGAAGIEITASADFALSGLAIEGWDGLNVSGTVSSATLKNVSIKNCHNAIAGGGLWIASGAGVHAEDLEIADCYVTGNGTGGGISVGSGATFVADGLVVTACYVAGENSDGGGIANHGTAILKNATISGCAVGRNGKGIFNANEATLVLDGECDIQSEVYLESSASPIYVQGADFALASGAVAIPVTPKLGGGANDYQEGSAVIQGYDLYEVTKAQVSCFSSTVAYSIKYDASVPCGKLVDDSVTGGIAVGFEGSVSFAITPPTVASPAASFAVKDSSSGTAVEVEPTSARIQILQYGAVVFGAEGQSVAASYLPAGSYELYCRAVYNGVVYDTTVQVTVE